MAAPARRPQYLLPWIVLCTLVLGAGLQLIAPADPGRTGDGVDAGAAVPDARPAAIPVANPAAGGIVAQDPALQDADLHLLESDPERPDFRSEVGVDESVPAGAARLADFGAPPPAFDPARILEPEAGPSAVGKPRQQPSLLHREDGLEVAFESALPPIGAAWRVAWSGRADSPDRAEAPGDPELVIVRTGRDSFRAILVLDDAAEQDQGSGDLAVPGDGGFGAAAGSGSEASGGTSQEPPATGSGESRSRRVWARWFAAHVPAQPQWRPDSREELRDLLARMLGERKTRYLAAASRELNAREAAQLLHRARHWVADRRG